MNKEKYIGKKNIKNILVGIGFILLSIFFIESIFISSDTPDYNQGELLFIFFSFTILTFMILTTLFVATEYFKTDKGDDEK